MGINGVVEERLMDHRNFIHKCDKFLPLCADSQDYHLLFIRRKLSSSSALDAFIDPSVIP